MTKTIIYDIGANNGDDIPYYLLKSDVVVAVEANPLLCDLIRKRFPAEVRSGRLAIENCVVTAEGESGLIDFYIHKSAHVLSQLPAPSNNEAHHYEKVTLSSRNISEILKQHGAPYYVKIDIEHYDAPILRALFAAGFFPPFISAESHSIEVFSVLVTQGHYNAFKLVDGFSVSQEYSACVIATGNLNRLTRYSFPYHSAGPFGHDIKGRWMRADTFLWVLALEKLGWKDIHATSNELTGPLPFQGFGKYLIRYFLRRVQRKMAVFLRSISLLSRT